MAVVAAEHVAEWAGKDTPPEDSGARSSFVEFVRGWLRRWDTVDVVSIASWGRTRCGSGSSHDRAFDKVAQEADLQRVMSLLPPLHRRAAELSRRTVREQGWFRRIHAGLEASGLAQPWQDWTFEVQERRGDAARPFECLLDDAAGKMADLLGSTYWQAA